MTENNVKGIEIGSRLHNAWRDGRKLENGQYEPRWKATNDNLYDGIEGKVRYNENGNMEVDIANLNFEELPKDWQKENLEAGLAVANIVGDLEDISSEDMEKFSIEVHNAWCDRKIEEIRNYMNELEQQGYSKEDIDIKVDEKYAWDKRLLVSYEELSEDEKQKDRNHVVEAIKLNKEIARGEISLDDLYKKYDKEAKIMKN